MSVITVDPISFWPI